MKNIILSASVFLLILTSCNSDDDQPQQPVITPSFTFDNQTYSVLPAQGINEQQMDNFITLNDIPYDRSQISIIGMLGFGQTATIAFDVYHREGASIAGTYNIYDDDDSNVGFEDFVTPLDRGCMGWTSLAGSYGISGEGVNANNPEGTVTITVNSTNNYTIHYVGNFRIYNDDFEIERTVPCTMNVTGVVTQQN
jgi:hypothetical protein